MTIEITFVDQHVKSMLAIIASGRASGARVSRREMRRIAGRALSEIEQAEHRALERLLKEKGEGHEGD